MGGSITVVSAPGAGSTFTFHFPLEVAPRAASRPSAPVSNSPETHIHEDALVLVVDDDKTSSLLAGEMLRLLGYRAEFANNGEEAVKAFRPERYSAILMDLEMPLMNGIEAVARIRRVEAATDTRVPIIAFTADVMPGDRERCAAAGMDDFLAKPFRTEELAARLACAASRG